MLRVGQLYRVDLEIVGFEIDHAEHLATILVPSGAKLRVTQFRSHYDIRLTTVDWAGRSIMVFRPDLAHRATQLEQDTTTTV